MENACQSQTQRNNSEWISKNREKRRCDKKLDLENNHYSPVDGMFPSSFSFIFNKTNFKFKLELEKSDLAGVSKQNFCCSLPLFKCKEQLNSLSLSKLVQQSLSMCAYACVPYVCWWWWFFMNHIENSIVLPDCVDNMRTIHIGCTHTYMHRHTHLLVLRGLLLYIFQSQNGSYIGCTRVAHTHTLMHLATVLE